MGWQLAVDFGTSFTAAAIATDGGRPEVLDVDNRSRMASMVLLTADGRLLAGRTAQNQAAQLPDRVERTPKRYVGTTEHLLLGGESVTVVDAVAAVLRRVLDEARQRHEGAMPDRVVLTHPARWSGPQLAVLLHAAAVVGIDAPELVAEPVAAALAFSEAPIEPGKCVAVYDLGGGTFDTAVLRRTAHGFDVAGPPGGDPNVGGEVFDERLYSRVGELIAEHDPEVWQNLVRPEDRPWRNKRATLQQQVRDVKEQLSDENRAAVYVEALDQDIRLTRAEFEELIVDDLRATVGELADTIDRASIVPSELAAIYLVGGSSRIPLAASLVHEHFGFAPSTRGDPKCTVVLGALQFAPSVQPATRPRVESLRRIVTATVDEQIELDCVINDIDFSRDGRHLAVSCPSDVSVLDLSRPESSPTVRQLPANVRPQVRYVNVGELEYLAVRHFCLDDEPEAALDSLAHSIEVWHPHTLATEFRLGLAEVPQWITCHPRQPLLASSQYADEESCRLFKVTENAIHERVRFSTSSEQVNANSLEFSGDGHLLVAALHGRRYISLFDLEGRNVADVPHTLDYASNAALDRSGSFCAVTGSTEDRRSALELVETKTGRVSFHFETDRNVSNAVFDPVGHQLFFTEGSHPGDRGPQHRKLTPGLLRVVDPLTGEVTRALKHAFAMWNDARSLCIRSDGSALAAGTHDGVVIVTLTDQESPGAKPGPKAKRPRAKREGSTDAPTGKTPAPRRRRAPTTEIRVNAYRWVIVNVTGENYSFLFTRQHKTFGSAEPTFQELKPESLKVSCVETTTWSTSALSKWTPVALTEYTDASWRYYRFTVRSADDRHSVVYAEYFRSVVGITGWALAVDGHIVQEHGVAVPDNLRSDVLAKNWLR